MHDENQTRNFHRIFLIDSKKELKKHCKDTIISKRDFSKLVFSATYGKARINCMSHYDTFEPEHLRLNELDHKAIANNGVGSFKPNTKKSVNKITQMFEDRKISAGHLFYNNDFSRWYFFYFDQRDVSKENNNWKCGSHVHLINWLWPTFNSFGIWKDFVSDKKCPRPSSGLHIRFIDT